ncbi:MAG: hypothetical protein EA424_15765 [Planctomycetaceae bacterium]|nr:MAG: hypothetical protein EA424_15765 [Planctomycetaceae bacterium]
MKAKWAVSRQIFFQGAAVVALGLSAAVFVSVTMAEEFRTWTDSEGRYSVQAKLSGVADGKVMLVCEDSDEIEIQLDRLSEADRQYVEAWQVEQENPFRRVTPAAPSPAAPSPAMPATAKPTLVTGDWTGVRAVDMVPLQDQWEFPVEATPLDAEPAVVSRIPLPPKTDFFESTTSLIVHPPAGRAVVGYLVARPRTEGEVRLVLVDLKDGSMIAQGTSPGRMEPVALADDGKRVLMRRKEFGSGNNDRLEIWTVTPSGIERGVPWIPYDSFQRGQRDVKWAAFLAEDRVATLGGEGRLAVWTLGAAQPLYYLQIAGSCIPALSPDRQWLAFSTGKEIGVLDVDEGRVLALQSTPNTPFPVLQFSPDASRLALAAHQTLYVWDFATGELYRDIPLRNLHVGGALAFAGNGHVLVAKRYLFDLENQVRIWEYQGHDLVEMVDGICWFVVSQGQKSSGALVPQRIPQPEVQAAIEQALQEPDFFVLKPGTAVRVILDALPDAGAREKVRAALSEKLEANGFHAADDGTIDLIANVETGDEREVTYRTIGRGFGVRTYKFRPHISQLRFVYEGETAWQVQASNVPGFVRLAAGETMEQFLKRQEKPNYHYFERVALPKILIKPTGSPTLGSSKVTVAGLQ